MARPKSLTGSKQRTFMVSVKTLCAVDRAASLHDMSRSACAARTVTLMLKTPAALERALGLIDLTYPSGVTIGIQLDQLTFTQLGAIAKSRNVAVSRIINALLAVLPTGKVPPLNAYPKRAHQLPT